MCQTLTIGKINFKTSPICCTLPLIGERGCEAQVWGIVQRLFVVDKSGMRKIKVGGRAFYLDKWVEI